MKRTADISVVIPTRNRPDNLSRALHCISVQKYVPKEVIIVDSSDKLLDETTLTRQFPVLRIRYFSSVASVCIQRNIGIKNTVSPYVFLWDDDIEISPDYLEKAAAYIASNPTAPIVTGIVKEKDKKGNWESQFSPGTSGLFKALIFHHSLWADVSGIRYTILNFLPLYFLKKTRRTGNSLSIAGWPRVIDFSAPVFKTLVYGLGACVAKKETLLQYPFDEVLDSYGIGDNYALVMSIPGRVEIHVLTEAEALHHQSQQNRLQRNTAYFRRVLALHYVMCTSAKFNFINRMALVWSVFGNALIHLFRMNTQLLRINIKLIIRITLGKNPYLLGKRRKLKRVAPEC